MRLRYILIWLLVIACKNNMFSQAFKFEDSIHYVDSPFKLPQLTFFSKDDVKLNNDLQRLTPEKFKNHQEYGRLPFNAPCTDCAELIEKRTINSRYYIKNDTEGKEFYLQTNYEDLHYLNQEGDLITIDPRLMPDPQTSGIFKAPQQPYPTSLNMNENYSSIQVNEDFEYKFNMHLKIENGESIIPINTNTYTVGDNGLSIINGWDGVGMNLIYDRGSVESIFIFDNKNIIRSSSKQTIIEEKINIPENFRLVYDEFNGQFIDDEIWYGDLLIEDEFGHELIQYSTPTIWDNSGEKKQYDGFENKLIGYKIKNVDGECFLDIVISNEWLLAAARVYPVTIDPLVSVTSAWAGTNGSAYVPNYCSLIFNITLPGNSTFTNCVVNHTILTGAACAGSCWLSNTFLTYVTTCASSGYWTCLGCNFPGGWAPASGTSIPSLVTCFTPSCSDYTVPFEVQFLRNYCAGGTPTVCTTTCLKITSQSVVVEGHTVEVTALAEGAAAYTVVDCADQSGWISAGTPNYGVPGYTYSWTPTGYTGVSEYVTFPLGVTVYTVTITDACGNTATDAVTVTNNCIVLPINLLSFTGYHQNSSNYLDWEADAGSNPNPFIVERSPNGLNFEQIGEIEIDKQESNTNRYSFIDKAPFEGLNYYRLKRTENGKSTSISDVIAIKASDIYTSQIIINDQNPVGDGVNLTVFSTQEGLHDLNLFDVTGKLISTRPVELIKGATTVTFHLPDVASGVYLFAISINGDLAEAKFIK